MSEKVYEAREFWKAKAAQALKPSKGGVRGHLRNGRYVEAHRRDKKK